VRKATQKECQKTPLALTILPYRGRRLWWPLIFLANVLLWVIGRAGEITLRMQYWFWREKGWLARQLANIFWRAATLLSVSYLVYDRIYETSASISVPASDSKNPFLFPFVITNNSHVFRIRNIVWSCQYAKLQADHVELQNVAMTIRGSKSEIGEGQSLNILCNPISPTSQFIRIDKMPVISEAVIAIQLTYDSDIFGFLWRRHPPMTTFTWAANATNPQWIRGDYAQ
jgi:hypothetical protein